MPCFDSQADEYNKAAIRAACEMAKFIKLWLFREDMEAGLSKETLDWIKEHERIDSL